MRAAHRSSDQEVGWAPKICCILTIVLGGLGGAARLACWDVADFRTPTIQAEAEDGTWVDVPLFFFLAQSNAMGHAQENQAVMNGHYSPQLTDWGSVLSFHRAQSSGTCPTPPELAKPESPADRAERLDRLGRFLRAHHRKMLALVDESGYYNFYVARLFHLPSNYWMNEKFNTMNIRKIKHYRLVTQSICYTLVDGRLVEHVVKEDAVVFDVGE